MVEAKIMAVSTNILVYTSFVLIMTTFLTGGKFSFFGKTIINLESKFSKTFGKALGKLQIEEIYFQKR